MAYAMDGQKKDHNVSANSVVKEENMWCDVCGFWWRQLWESCQPMEQIGQCCGLFCVVYWWVRWEKVTLTRFYLSLVTVVVYQQDRQFHDMEVFGKMNWQKVTTSDYFSNILYHLKTFYNQRMTFVMNRESQRWPMTKTCWWPWWQLMTACWWWQLVKTYWWPANDNTDDHHDNMSCEWAGISIVLVLIR